MMYGTRDHTGLRSPVTPEAAHTREPRPEPGVTGRSIDAAELRAIFGAFPSGVVAVAGLVDSVPVGMAVSSFTSVSLAPPLALFCVGSESTTWPVLQQAESLGISVFAEGQAKACRQMSSRSSPRFEGVGWRATGDGAVVLDDAAAYFECSIVEEVAAGDHAIVIVRIAELGIVDERRPLVFHRSMFGGVASVSP